MMPRALTVLCLLPLLAFGHWELDFDEDFAAASVNKDVLDGLVAWWKMDEAAWAGTAGEVIDSSGNGNNGTAFEGANTVPGKIVRAGLLDGVSNYVRSASAVISGVSDITVSAWIKTVDDNAIICSNRDPGAVNGQFSVELMGGLVYYWEYDGGVGVAVYSSASVSDDAWHFVTVTKESGTAVVYVDGVQSGTNYSAQSISYNSTFPLTVGLSYRELGDPVWGKYFAGMVDDVRIYNRALSSNEVNTIYNKYK